MGLVQNLKKTLSNTASRILAELSSAFIRRRAKLILKKPDNSSETTSSPNPLTTEPPATTIATSFQGTSEKIIMEKTTEEIVSHIREWSLDRIADMHDEVAANHHDIGQLDDAYAIYQEFEEWIEPKGEDIELLTLEDD